MVRWHFFLPNLHRVPFFSLTPTRVRRIPERSTRRRGAIFGYKLPPCVVLPSWRLPSPRSSSSPWRGVAPRLLRGPLRCNLNAIAWSSVSRAHTGGARVLLDSGGELVSFSVGRSFLEHLLSRTGSSHNLAIDAETCLEW